MIREKISLGDFIFQPYMVEILKALKTPKRFNELAKTIKNKGTLSKKLSDLKKLGLIISTPIEIDSNYANGYTLSEKGKDTLRKLESIK
jgi:DNA-binding HxlR family transcriptional regulator